VCPHKTRPTRHRHRRRRRRHLVSRDQQRKILAKHHQQNRLTGEACGYRGAVVDYRNSILDCRAIHAIIIQDRYEAYMAIRGGWYQRNVKIWTTWGVLVTIFPRMVVVGFEYRPPAGCGFFLEQPLVLRALQIGCNQARRAPIDRQSVLHTLSDIADVSNIFSNLAVQADSPPEAPPTLECLSHPRVHQIEVVTAESRSGHWTPILDRNVTRCV